MVRVKTLSSRQAKSFFKSLNTKDLREVANRKLLVSTQKKLAKAELKRR